MLTLPSPLALALALEAGAAPEVATLFWTFTVSGILGWFVHRRTGTSSPCFDFILLSRRTPGKGGLGHYMAWFVSAGTTALAMIIGEEHTGYTISFP